jgi:hypothetical protein
VPGPGNYELKSSFSHSELPKYTFGASAKAYKKVVLFNKIDEADTSIPGPGAYNQRSMLGREGWKITMGVGTKNSKEYY